MLYDLIIIGGGPAGITAGIYAARHKLNVLLITKEFGGQMAWKAVNIENYPGFEEISGLELVEQFEKHLRKYQVEIERDEVVKLEKNNNDFLVNTKDKKTFKAKTIIIASGADPRLLNVAGEKEFIGRGVSYCTVCDAPMFSKKIVAVIGGGNSAFEAAINLVQWVEKIYLLEASEKICADLDNQEKLKQTNKAEIIVNAQVKEIKGDKFVKSLIYLDKKTNKENVLNLAGIFVEIGRQPAVNFIKQLIELNDKNEIKIDCLTNQTSCPGVFAAGDVVNIPLKQIVIAAGQGAKAAISAHYYLQKVYGKQSN